MSIVRLPGFPRLWPQFPRRLENQDAAPSLETSTMLLDAANERIAVIGHVLWDDGATHDIDTIRFRTGGATSPSMTLRVSLRDVDATAGPPGQDDSTVDQSATQVNPAANTVYSLALDADRTSVAHGALLAVVFDVDTYTSGAIRIAGLTVDGTVLNHRPLWSHRTGAGSWTIGTGVLPGITLLSPAGANIGIIAGLPPCITAAVTAVALNTGTTPDEAGLEFTVPAPMWAGGFEIPVNPAAGADFDVVLYEGTTVKATVSFDANTWAADAVVRLAQGCFTDVPLTVGQTYRLVVKPTTANSVTVYYATVTAAAEVNAFAGTVSWNERTDAGAWGAAVATRIPFMSIGISAVDSGGSGGGAGRGNLNGGLL